MNYFFRQGAARQRLALIKKLCFVVLAGCTVQATAQYNTNFLNYGNTGRSVSANLDFEAGSDGMSTRLVNKLVWGGYIDNKDKEESSRLLRARNNIGLAVNYDLTAFVKGNKHFDLLIGFKNQEVLNASYTRDAFNLVFYGNERYRGATADLRNCNVNALRFQEIKFGAIIHHVDSLGKIGISISVLKGEQLFYLKTHNNSGLYTSQDGSELVLNSDFNMALSDTNNRGLGGFNGLGASSDIYFETPYKSRFGTKNVLMVNANNIGFIHWWQNSVQYNSDSSFRFKGYTINSVTDLKDSTLNTINNDSLLRKLTNARNENFNVNIPTNLVIINKMFFGAGNVALSTGFRYIFNANYRPYIFLEPELRKGNFIVSLHTGYGGYTRLNVGASLSWNGPRVFFRLGSNSLQGYLFPKTSYGQGLYCSLALKLK